MNFRSLRLLYTLIGLLLGIGAPIGAFVIRYLFLPQVHAAPIADLATPGEPVESHRRSP